MCLVLFGSLRAEASLSEDEVIDLVRSKMPEMEVARATVALGQNRSKVAAPLFNPRLTVNHEGLENGNFEQEVALQVPLPTTQRAAERRLARASSFWLRVDATQMRRAAVVEALRIYYQWHAASAQSSILSQSVANLKEATRVLGARTTAGVASEYERHRLALATQLAESDLAQAHGQSRAWGAALSARLVLEGPLPEPEADLRLLSLPDEKTLLERALGKSGLVADANFATFHAKQAEQSARLGFIPQLTVTGGLRRVRTPVDLYGFVVGLNVELPVFDRRQVVLREAENQRSLSHARSSALTAQLQAALQSHYATYIAAVDNLRAFEQTTTDSVDVLLKAAHTGYREGVRTIVELLDAQRTQTDVATRRTSLLLMAKQAEAELRALSGEFE